MPGYGEMLATAERWKALPGLERVPGDGAVLTFDDGPDPDGTPLILDALDAAGVRATFFVVGEQLMRHHAVAREALARGHELALHGFEHVRHDTLPGRMARDDVARSVGTFQAATGRSPRFFRPPYGGFTEHSHEACADLGLEPVLWSAWGMDWETIAAERIADLVNRDLAAGAIVLLHDSARYGHRPGVQPTADAIAAIAARAAELEIVLAPLGAMAPSPGAP
jgi:peptidoglycan/xylan/chitin deacetylase (PgdA/CDA1 family)